MAALCLVRSAWWAGAFWRELRPASAQSFRQGGEFQVNAHTTGIQSLPGHRRRGGRRLRRHLDATPSTATGSGSSATASTRRESRQGLQFQVNTYTTRGQHRSVGGVREQRRLRRRLAELPPGRAGHDRVLRRLRASGSPPPAPRIATEFQVNTYTHQRPGVSAGRLGQRRRLHRGLAEHRPGQHRLRRWRLRPRTSPRPGTRWPPSSWSTPAPSTTSSVPTSRPTPTATSSSPGRATSRKPPAARTESSRERFNSAGVAQAAEFQVNTYTVGPQAKPAVAARRRRRLRGRLEQHVNQESPGYSDRRRRHLRAALHLRRRAAGGRVPGQHLHAALSALPAGRRRRQTATSSSPGRASYQDGNYEGVFARRVARQRRVRARVPGEHLHHGRTGASRWWTSTATATSSSPGTPRSTRTATPTASSPSASRCRRSPILDIDGNGAGRPAHRRPAQPAPPLRLHRRRAHQRSGRQQLHALHRGTTITELPQRPRTGARHRRQRRRSTPSPTELLVLRFMFGFTGTTLTNGALARTAARAATRRRSVPYLQTLD